MAASNNGKGKFVNAFQSLQMIGDYEGNDEAIERPNKQPANNVTDDVDHFVFDMKSNEDNKDSLYNGDELYNPLDMEESSDDEDKNNENLQNTTTETNTPLTKPRVPSQNSNLNTALPEVKGTPSITDEEPAAEKKSEIPVLEHNEDRLDQKSGEFKIEKSPEQIIDDKQDVFVDDVDDLLGTALAELEEEEKEAEMQKLHEKESKEGRKESKHKKKKKSKDKNTDEKDKKKKKKKKKKKGRDKTKDKDKENDEQQITKKKDKKKKEDRKSVQSLEEKDTKDLKSEKEQRPKVEKDKENRSSKDSKSKRDKSPSKKKDKKRRDSSKDRKNKEKRGSEENKKEKSRRSSKDGSHNDNSKHKDKHGDNHKSRKRTHKDDKLDDNAKRSRKSHDILEKTDKSTKKLDRNQTEHTKRDRRYSLRESSPDNKKRRSRSPISSSKSHSSERKTKIDSDVKSPPNTEHEKKTREKSLAILSKEEFARIQKEARKDEGKPHVSTSHHSSDSENEREKVLQRSSFLQNFDQELAKFKSENRHEIDKPTDNQEKHSKSPKDQTDSHNSKQNEQCNNNPVDRSPSLEQELHMVSPPDLEKEDQETQESSSVDFEMSVNDVSKSNVNMYDVAISSQSDDYSVYTSEQKKNLKPGMLSINEYKDRRKSGKKDSKEIIKLSSSSQSDVQEVSSQTSLEEIQDPKRFDTESDHNTSLQNGAATLYDIGNFDACLSTEPEFKPSIPLLDATFKQNTEHGEQKEISPVKKKTRDGEEESPYNPEASPIDFESPVPSPPSPSNVTVEDDNVEILYKDIVSFQDIMKSKVKHEAKKHKRKKLEEMKSEMEGRGATKKEQRLVDYLIRQAQVEEIMKNTLKNYFKSKEITKEEYKSILKKAVPQVTMSNSSIIPEKIDSLMQKFVRKCKGQRAKAEKEKNRRKQQDDLVQQQKELEQQLQTNAAIIDSFPFQQITALNPNLPLPPM